jgi:ion channel-forming bestrophin family protein
MIFYEPNKNWFRDIRHLSTSWTIQKIMHGVLFIGFLSTLICVAFVYFEIVPSLNSGIFSLLGIVLSILLVFRTNTAYDRWWEGRKQWGELVNQTRNLSVLLHACLPKEDQESRMYFAKYISSFSAALTTHLRSGTNPEELTDLTEEEKNDLRPTQHIPNYLAFLIANRVQTIYEGGGISDANLINIHSHHQSLINVLGACERIKKTPIPFSYAVYIKIFISLYGIMLPFGLFRDFHFYTIPLVMFIFFAMLGIELMAQEIEDPFGLDCNDLPTGDIANTIRKNVFEILTNTRSKVSKPNEIYSKVF